MTFSAAYRRFRSGWGFLALLAAVIAGWMAVHFITGFDPDFTELNLLLSIEASAAVTLLIGQQEEREAAQREIEETTLALVEEIDERVEELAEHP